MNLIKVYNTMISFHNNQYTYYLQLIKKHNSLDLYALKLSKLVDCLVRLIRGNVVKGSVDDFLRVEFLEVL